MIPLPWSPSGLETFVTCPRQYEAKYVSKSVQEIETEDQLWGKYVHKHFELRQKDNTPLPGDLEEHEEYMAELSAKPGQHFTERRVALNLSLKPCDFFADDVWYRGVIDWTQIDGCYARVVDYKTGRPHEKFKQLKTYALHIFAEFPEVESVRCDFYWTKHRSISHQRYDRTMIPKLWKEFAPDLYQYVEAFKSNVWQPRQNGLCFGWCPVMECEFWKPKKKG